MIIDAFTHIYPRPFIDHVTESGLSLPVFFRDEPGFIEPKARLVEMDRHGIEMQVLALGTPPLDEWFGPDEARKALRTARIANDEVARIVDDHPGRFVGVATLPLVGLESVDIALDELERAAEKLGLRGIQLYTTIAQNPLDAPQLMPLYERLSAYDLPILLHPSGGDYYPSTRDYLLWLTFGWPFETTLAMARLVYSGVLERFPRLKILTHHLGAFVPHMAERVKGVTLTLERTSDWSLPNPVLAYFKRFYGDTAVNGYEPALNSGYHFFGPSQILFATDYPFVPIDNTLESVLEWELSDEEKSGILGGNARQLFQIRAL